MPKPGDKTKKKKFRKVPSGKTKQVFERGKPRKQACALCEKQLHGVPHGKRKSELSRLSKSKKRPTSKFAGVLCGACRKAVAEEAAKVVSKIKRIEEVSLKMKSYVSKVVQ